jgi:hypothetical protein
MVVDEVGMVSAEEEDMVEGIKQKTRSFGFKFEHEYQKG